MKQINKRGVPMTGVMAVVLSVSSFASAQSPSRNQYLLVERGKTTEPAPYVGLSAGQCLTRKSKTASARYKRYHDYTSLKTLTKCLKLGMPRSEVESLLGEPDYSPIEGQYYYSSNRKNAEGVILGLVVEYRKTTYGGAEIKIEITGKLESFSLMPIGE